MLFLSRRFSRSFLFACALLAFVCVPAWSQDKPKENEVVGKIQLSVTQIPKAPASLPVLRLTAQKPPTEFVQETLRRKDPKAEKLVPELSWHRAPAVCRTGPVRDG